MIEKKNTYKILCLFLFSHLIIWTLVPFTTNVNLPLDTIEALAWGSSLDWGFNKHPPFSAFAVEFFYKIFGNQDWSYYLLSQIFVITAFIFVYLLSIDLFKNKKLALLSIFLLEGIFFYNYTTPEFNVNVSQLPFWASSIYFSWRCLKNDKIKDYVFLGILMGLGFLSKYLFLFLIIGIELLFFFFLLNKKIKTLNFILSGIVAFIVIFPHIIWLFENNFVTLTYGIQRTGENSSFLNHFIFPLKFIFKQIIVLIPFFLMSIALLKKIKIKKIKLNQEVIFLSFTFFMPLIMIIITSLVMGANIRTMWMTPFYLLAGVTFIYFLRENINFRKLKKFYTIFLFLFFISPISYAIVSLENDYKRTDYPGKEIARLVQNKWDDNYTNEINIVIGDEWFAGNLSYHLDSRPRWIIELKDNLKELNTDDGVIYTGNPKILKNICPGVFGTIKPVGYCMIGRK